MFFTDKTGTLAEGRISFASAPDPTGRSSDAVLRAGLAGNQAIRTDGQIVGGNPLDRALWESPDAARLGPHDVERLAMPPVDYDRRLASVLVQEGGERRIVVKGAPEEVLARCTAVAPRARGMLERLFAQGSRVIVVATRPAEDRTQLTRDDERHLALAGFLTFVDRPKPDAADALAARAGCRTWIRLGCARLSRFAAAVGQDLGQSRKRLAKGRDWKREESGRGSLNHSCRAEIELPDLTVSGRRVARVEITQSR